MRTSVVFGLVALMLFVSGCADTSVKLLPAQAFDYVFSNSEGVVCWSSTISDLNSATCWDADSFEYSSPVWSDTNEVIAVREIDNDYYEIIALDVQNRTMEVIAHSAQQPRELQVSVDGKAILFLAGNNGYITTRTATASTSSNTVRVYEGVRNMSWLGDAKTFMYVTTNNRLLVQKRMTDGSLLDAKTILETDVYAAAAIDGSTALVVRKGDGQFELQQVDVATSLVNRVTSWSSSIEGTTPQLDTQLGLAWNRRYAFVRQEQKLTILSLQTDSVLASLPVAGEYAYWLGDSTHLLFHSDAGRITIGKVQTQSSPATIELQPIELKDLQYRVSSPNML